MALDAGSVFAVLGGKFNPAGFAQFDATMKKSSATAAKSEAAMSGSFKRSGAASAAMAATVAKSAAKVEALMIAQQKATLGVEKAQIAAGAATSKFGAESLKAREKTLALTAAQQKLGAATTELTAAQHAHTAVQAKSAQAMSRTGGAMSTMGSAAKTGAAAGVLAVGYALVKSVQSAATFEKKMSELQAVTRASASTMKTMSRAALDLGAKTGVGATEAAGALTELAKGGLDANTSIAALSGTIALAQAGDMDLADAANTVVKSLSLFSLKGADAGHVADGLASAANATSMDVKDFAQALAQGGSAAAAAGFSFDDTINVMASMANKFQSGSDLGTSLKTTLVQMANPSKKAAAEMDRLGISIFKANGQIKPVASIVSMLGNRFKGMSDKQKLSTAATIAGTDGMRTLLALLGGSGKDIIVPGSAADIAAKKMDNYTGSTKRLAAEIETLKIEAGQGITPALADATNAVTKFLAQMREGKGIGGIFSSIVGVLWDVQKALYSTVTGAGAGFLALLEAITGAGAFLGIPGAKKASDDLAKMRRELENTTKELLPFHNEAKKPVNVKLVADKTSAISAIKAIQNSKLAPKVQKILGSSKDATDKIMALMRLGIPLKWAKILTNANSTQGAIKKLKAELASIRNPPAIVFTATEGGSQRAWNRLGGSPLLRASGTSAGFSHKALVGEGGGPEWIVNRDTGAARKTTGPQLTNLSASEYVIPTESKYRPQALGLLGMLAADLGVSGFASGKEAKKKRDAAKKKRDRRYAAQDRRAQGYSDRASEQGTWMDTYQQRGDSGKWRKAKARQARYLGLERDYVAAILRHPGRSKGARLQVMKSLRAQIANDIETNKAAEFSKAESATYTKAEQDKITGFGAKLAIASLTATLDDDRAVLGQENTFLTNLWNSSISKGQRGNQAIIDVAGDLKSVRDQIAGLTPTTPDITADQQAQADQTARNQTMAAQSAAIDRLAGATLGGSPTLVFQSYVPPSPTEARRLADYTVGGIGYQGGTQSSKDSVGI